MANIKQTDLLEYLVKKFNDNSFGIPFRMGTYNGDETGITIYAPSRDNEGKFDQQEIFDEETYALSKKSFVVMSGLANSGEYTPLPNIQMVAYEVGLEFLVYVDSPISEFIRMAIEEVRDKLIGALDVMEIKEIDLENENDIITDYLRLVTSADSIDFGQIITIKKRNYMSYGLNVYMTVSKNVEMGNQIKWEFRKKLTEEECVEPIATPLATDYGKNVLSQDFSTWTAIVDETEWTLLVEEPLGEPDYFIDDLADLEDPITKVMEGKITKYLTKKWEYKGEDLGIAFDLNLGSYETLGTNEADNEFILNLLNTSHSAESKSLGDIAKTELYQGEDYWDVFFEVVVDVEEYYIATIISYEWEFVSEPTTKHELIPLDFSWGTNQDQESFQTLRPLNPTLAERAKEVHNYVKSRGFGTTFTFLADFSNYMNKQLYIETFKKQIKPRVYEIIQKTLVLTEVEEEIEGEDVLVTKFVEDVELTFTRNMIFGEAQIGDTSYGEPIVFAIGFTPSAKDV